MSPLLMLHIFGAIGVGALIICSLFSVIQQQTGRFSFFSKSIAVCGAYQLLTGSLLAWTIHGTVLAFCQRVGLYFAIIVLIEALLFSAMKKSGQSFPTRVVSSSFSLGMVSVLTTVVYLLR